MAIKDLKISNLEAATPAAIPAAALPPEKLKVEPDGKLVWEGIEADPQFPKPKVVEVSWTAAEGKTALRGDGSKAAYDAVAKTFTIPNLSPVTPFGLNFSGKVEIKDPKKPKETPAAATLKVRIGNMGKDTRGQWVIDLSDKEADGPPSSVNVSVLLAWLQGQASTEQPDTPPMENPKQLEDLVVIFDEFHFNITNKSFDINVHSTGSLKIGAFEIKDLALQLTNEPQKEKKSIPAV